MRNYPDTEEEMQEATNDLKCDPAWIELLKENPDYCCWGPHEDYQSIQDPEDPGSYRMYSSWSDFRSTFRLGQYPTMLNDRSGGEVVNWYFSLHHDGVPCQACDRTGSNPKTAKLYRNWYNHSSDTGKGWCSSLTQGEVDRLIAEGRLWDFIRVSSMNQLNKLVAEGKLSPEDALQRWESRNKAKDHERKDDQGHPMGEILNHTVRWRDSVPAEEVNAADRERLIHDAINCWICVRHRAERLGVYGTCKRCDGQGFRATSPTRIQLVLWVINPATGQSYGVEIDRVRFEEIGEIRNFLHTVRGRLDRRFDVRELRVAPSLQDGLGLVIPPVLDGENRGWTAAWCAAMSFASAQWDSPLKYPSWSQMRAKRNWKGDLLDPESPDYAETPHTWELDDLNEVAWFRFDLNAVGDHILFLWMMHPRKGCTRRLMIERVDLADIPDIKEWLTEARRRTNLRFGKLA